MSEKVFSNPRMESIQSYAEQSALVHEKFLEIAARLGADQALLYSFAEDLSTLRNMEVEFLIY